MSGPRTTAGPVVLGLDQIQAAVTLPAAVQAVEDSFRALVGGHATQPPALGIDLPSGEVHVKAAQLAPEHSAVVKVASGFPGNARLGLPTGDGVMVVLDPDTGAVTALLLDRGWLTDVRTAAATAVTVRLLSPAPARRLAVLGTGVQARLTLLALRSIGRLPAHVAVWGRTTNNAHRLSTEPGLRELGLQVVAAAADAVRGADVVITTTAAREPILHGRWLQADALVVAVGADSPGKRECDDTTLRRADQLVVDDLQQAVRLGELQHDPTPAATTARLSNLGALLTSTGTARTTGICLCDLTGLGAHDAAIATLALTEATRTHPAPPPAMWPAGCVR